MSRRTPGAGSASEGTVTAAELADRHYEELLTRSFREAHRVLKPDGVMTVMFTHKRVDAWDTLGRGAARGRLRDPLVVARAHRERALAPPGEEERGAVDDPPHVPQARDDRAGLVGGHPRRRRAGRRGGGRALRRAGHPRRRPHARDVRPGALRALAALARVHGRARRRREPGGAAARRRARPRARARGVAQEARPARGPRRRLRPRHRLVPARLERLPGGRVPVRRGAQALDRAPPRRRRPQAGGTRSSAPRAAR